MTFVENLQKSHDTRCDRLEARLLTSERKIVEQTGTIKKLEDSYQNLLQTTEDIQARNSFGTTACSEIQGRVDDLEDRSRRNNLCIEGIQESPRESWESTASKVLKLIKDKLSIQRNIEIERAHRVGRSLGNRPRTIVVKFLRFQDKDEVFQKKKLLARTDIYINEDFCRATIEERNRQLPQLKQAREAGKIAYFSHRTLKIRDKPHINPGPASSTPISDPIVDGIPNIESTASSNSSSQGGSSQATRTLRPNNNRGRR